MSNDSHLFVFEEVLNLWQLSFNFLQDYAVKDKHFRISSYLYGGQDVQGAVESSPYYSTLCIDSYELSFTYPLKTDSQIRFIDPYYTLLRISKISQRYMLIGVRGLEPISS